MNKIGIIVPVYNVKDDYLRECIESLIHQTYEDIQIFIVDDKSKDKCALLCDELAGLDKRITVIHHDINKGLPGARNTGLMACNTDWVTFVDGDDWIDSDMCERFVRYLEDTNNNPDVYIFSGYRSYPGHEEGNHNERGIKEFVTKEEIEQLQIDALTTFLIGKPDNTVPFDSAWAKFYKRSYLSVNNIEFRDLPFREDGMFFQESIEYANLVVYSPDLLYHYRMCKNSMVNVYRKNHTKELEKYLGMLWAFAERRGKKDNYYKAIYGAAFFGMQTAITNYFYNPNCPLNRRQRKKSCEAFFEQKYFSGVFDAFQRKDIKRNHRIKMFLIKHKRYGCVQLLRKWYLKRHKRECFE